jgi:chromosome segregation ATPase
MGLHVRTALAEAARARGLSTGFDREIRTLTEQLSNLTVEAVETEDQRRAVAAASTETDQLQEEVAQVRGELIARREGDAETETVAEQFRDAARDLSEAETTAAAARQNLDRRRRKSRAARDRLERRFALEDDLENLRRQARAALVDRVRGAYESTVVRVPGGPESVTDPFDVDAVTAALAVGRIAAFDAPVVLACDRFSTPRAASAWLGAPVIRVQSR